MNLHVQRSHLAGAGLEPALQARYGSEAPDVGDVSGDVLAGLLDHRSVRAYLPDPLAPGVLEAIIAAAQSAATSSNQQFWSVVAVEDAGRKARLAELAGGQAHIRQAPLFLVWLADLSRACGIAAKAGESREALDYLETLVVSVADVALAAQNAVVALESLALGSVYIGAIRNRPELVAAELGLPPLTLPVFGLCVGHPDPERPASVKPRLPQSAVLHRETYSTSQDAAVSAYDQTLYDFQQSQNLPQIGWKQSVISRVSKVRSLNGRERLREALLSFGFLLN